MSTDESRVTAAVLRSSRREAIFVAVMWVLFSAYTVGYSALFGYRQDAAPHLVFGMPAWVFWGVVVPWFTCTLITCWYAFFGIRDEDLGEENTAGGGTDG
jgi:hypothetical protein